MFKTSGKRMGQLGGGVFRPIGVIANMPKFPIARPIVQGEPKGLPHPTSFLERSKGGKVNLASTVM